MEKIKVVINTKELSIDFDSFFKVTSTLLKKIKNQNEQITLLEEQTKLIDYWKQKYFDEINRKRGL